MFTLEQIADIHDRLGRKDTLGAYLDALREIGVASYDSFLTDGHAEYRGADGRQLTGPAMHEPLIVAATSDGMPHLDDDLGYMEMSKVLADHGVEKWTFDTHRKTITYVDRAGRALLTESVA